MCSVFNCTSTNCNFYVRCKNCSRLFCQKCVSTSISARRCYKRPRGHSFMYIPCNAGNASSNNNQSHQHLHHHFHHSHQRSSCMRQHDRQGQQSVGEARGMESSSSSPTPGSWHCAQCLTVNQPQSGVQRCTNCGQVNESHQEADEVTELMTFPPSPGDVRISSPDLIPQANPTPATESQEDGTRQVEVYNVDDSASPNMEENNGLVVLRWPQQDE